MTDETEFKTPRVALVAGVLAVAAAFTLLATTFGFILSELSGNLAKLGEVGPYRGLVTMGVLGGALGAVGAAMRFRLETWQTNLGWSFRAGSIATVLAVVATSWTGLLVAAFVMGAAGGWILTTLATGMRASVGTRRLGVVVGAGIACALILGEGGLVLGSWFGEPIKGAGIVIAMLLAATSVVVPFLTPLEPSMDMEAGYRGWGLAVNWVVMSAVIVGGFSIYRGGTEMPDSYLNIFVSVVCSLLLGRWLDADHRRYALLAAVGTLVVGSILRDTPGIGTYAPIIAISSTAVIAFHFAARGGRVWVAAGTVVFVFFIALNSVSWLSI